MAHKTWLHKLIGYTNFDSQDLTFNSRLAAIFVPGDGNHNNHHALPGAAHNKFNKKDLFLHNFLIEKINNSHKNNNNKNLLRELLNKLKYRNKRIKDNGYLLLK